MLLKKLIYFKGCLYKNHFFAITKVFKNFECRKTVPTNFCPFEGRLNYFGEFLSIKAVTEQILLTFLSIVGQITSHKSANSQNLNFSSIILTLKFFKSVKSSNKSKMSLAPFYNPLDHFLDDYSGNLHKMKNVEKHVG